MNKLTRHNFFKRFWWILLIIAVIGAFAGYQGWLTSKYDRSKDDQFISASPIDLSQFKQISKLRSCAGHDYFGTNVFGEQEASSSMKHYAVPLEKFEGTKDVKLYAPFDGKIVKIGGEKTGTSGEGFG